MSAATVPPFSSKMRSLFAPMHQTVAKSVSVPAVEHSDPPKVVHEQPLPLPITNVEPPHWMKPVEEEKILEEPVVLVEEKEPEEVPQSQQVHETSLESQMLYSLSEEDVPVELPPLEAIAPSMPMAVASATDTLNSQIGTSPSAKESSPLGFTIEKPGIDQVPGVQYVESEPQHELNPELEAYISKVENHQDQLPSEVVITNPAGIQPTTHYAATPVIVLPITPELEKTGSHKATSFSIRWLVEWSRKVMKMFHGQAVYKETV